MAFSFAKIILCMGSVHFYTATLGFAFGIFWQSFFDLSWAVMLWLLLVALGLYLVKMRRSPTTASNLIVLTLLAVALGLWRFDIARDNVLNPIYENQVGQEVSLTGVIVREPEIREKSVQLYVAVDEEIFFVSTDRYQEFSYGEKIEFTGELHKPEPFATDLGRTFDYPNYLLARGVAYTISFAKVEVVDINQGNWLLGQLFMAKQSFLNKLENVLVEPEVGLAEGLLLGVKRAIGEDLETIFRQTGIIHIVVLSGYNIMIVVTFVMYLLSRFLNKKWQVIFGVIAIVLFAILVGLSATVIRASIMASVLLVMGLTGRTYIALRGLFLAGAVMLFINPYLLAFDTGFQLSFLATLGLILVSPLLLAKLQFVPATIGVREFLVATIATQIMVLPLLLYSIGELSLVAVIVNVLVLPMVPVSMLLTFLTGLVAFLSTTLALPLAYLAHLSLTYIISLATWFASLPFASIAVPSFPFWLVPISYLCILYLIYRFRNENEETTNEIDEELLDWVIEDESEMTKTSSNKISIDKPLLIHSDLQK